MKIKHADLLLSTQHALLGRIGNSVLGICIKEQDLVIEMTVYTDGEASEEQREELDEGLAEIVSDFPWLNRIDIHFHNASRQQRLTTVGTWVFLRLHMRVN